jgi:hypothetical protein
MTSDGLGEMFEGYSADTHCQKISAHVAGGARGGFSLRRLGAKTPISVSGDFHLSDLRAFSTLASI